MFLQRSTEWAFLPDSPVSDPDAFLSANDDLQNVCMTAISCLPLKKSASLGFIGAG
jgi:hypothetical protein